MIFCLQKYKGLHKRSSENTYASIHLKVREMLGFYTKPSNRIYQYANYAHVHSSNDL